MIALARWRSIYLLTAYYFLGGIVGCGIICSAVVLVAVIILVGALKIAIDNSQLLLDKSYEFSKIEEIKKLVLSHTEIKSIDLLKSRVSGARVYIDMEITMDKNLSLYDSHEIVEHIRKDILDEYKEVLDVFIHANPSS